MLEIVLKALRIKTSSFNAEIQMLIDACKEELVKNGVDVSSLEIKNYYQLATINFCKGHFGNNPNAEKYLAIYENLKSYMMGISR